MECPAGGGGLAKQLRGAAIGQSGPAGVWAKINARHDPRRLAIGEEHRASGAAYQQAGQQECSTGSPEHPLDGTAFASETGALVGEIKVLNVVRQDFVGARRGLVQESPEDPLPQRDIVASP